MTTFQKLTSYFSTCYQADNRAISLSNFLGSKVEHQIIFNTAELLEGKLIQYPIHSEWAKKVQKTLQIYAKEKDLYSGAFFLLDKATVFSKVQNVCAPLLLFPLRLFEEKEIFYLEINGSGGMLNPAFVAHLKSSTEESSGLNDYMGKNLPEGMIDFEAICRIEEILGNAFPQLDLSPLSEFPKVYNIQKIKSALKNLSKPRIIPAVGAGVFKKSTIARGVLNELNDMAAQTDFSAILKDLFLTSKDKRNFRKPSDQIFAPANLSLPQQKIIHSSEVNTNTLVIGPPGTGKSFTVAAMAIDAISKGRSVLITSKNNQVLDVIAHKIEKDFGFDHLCVRGGNRDHKRFLVSKIKNILNGAGIVWISKRKIRQQHKYLRNHKKKIKQIEKRVIQREKDELAFVQPVQGSNRGLFHWLKNKRRQNRLLSSIPYWEIIDEWSTQLQLHNRLLTNYVRDCLQANIYYTAYRYRKDFQHLLTALRARTGLKKEQFFDTANFAVLLKAFPVWLVNTNDVHNFLPLRKELFDLVVIDEATQCDIASVLPLLFRAKRSVIIGDPKQLRHISFLSKQQQQSIVKAHGLDNFDTYLLNYRENSILDVVSHAIDRQNQVFFLDEHYRSLPDIIHFSNAFFYDNVLKVMTKTPHQVGKSNVDICICAGRRNKRGYNRVEADQILQEVLNIISDEKNIAPEYCRSIGILSPFRGQANHLRKKIEKQFNIDQLQKHRILVGTPFTFQGEERDIVFISFTVDEQVHASVYLYLNREDVFNVGITRARVEQRLFISMQPEKLNKKHLLSKYLHDVQQQNGIIKRTRVEWSAIPEDLFLHEVIRALKNRGIHQIYPEYQIAGTKIDLLFIHNGKTVCVDLVGYPGLFQEAFTTERYKMLFRIGIRIIVLPYRLWVKQEKHCINVLVKAAELN